jgi:xanthine dehydrogenase large subunit
MNDLAESMLVPSRDGITGAIGSQHPHESAHLHVAGEAQYTDDIPELRGTLYGAYGLSSKAHARVLAMDLSAVREAAGVVAVLGAGDVPGENDCGPVVHDDPIFATDVVQYAGQPLFLVVATTVDGARRAARLARVTYEDLPAVLSYEEALAAGAWIMPSVTLERGDAAAALAAAPHCLRGRFKMGGQEQFYLEGQIAYAVPKEDGTMLVYSSTQHPTEGQTKVAAALGRSAKDVIIECRRMGGAFGGKESQANGMACAAAVAAVRLERPVKVRIDRDDDFIITGKRHDFLAEYEVGFDGDGLIRGLDLMLASRCGYSTDLSRAVNDRAVLHADNAYFLSDVRIVSHRLKTNMQSATAFRGFGGPQGMLAIEYIVDEVARFLGRDPLEIRRRNLYGTGARSVTPYGQTVEDFIVPELFEELERSADYPRRRDEIRHWNRGSEWIKRGIALTPVKFGIAFTATFMNQGAALVHIYTDGSVLVNHGGTEMGQGLFTKVAQVVAEELQIDLARVRATATDTSKVPNTSPTAASSGSDINGRAAQAAARTLKERLIAFAAEHFKVPPAAVVFEANHVRAGDHRLSFAALVKTAYLHRVQLSATGYYRTPKIGYDPQTLKGRPFFYFAYGAAVSEVAVDTLTGETRLLRVDAVHDVGRSLNPAIDLGQVEGGYVQGLGWLTSEELCWDGDGRLRTHAPSTYKIPVASDVPAHFKLRLYERGVNVEDSIHRSKAVGEPPLMLPISAFLAIKDAVAAVADHQLPVVLNAPATPEEVLRAVDAVRAASR